MAGKTAAAAGGGEGEPRDRRPRRKGERCDQILGQARKTPFHSGLISTGSCGLGGLLMGYLCDDRPPVQAC